ncbi:hypothetical protein [Cupriavidus sp. TMH.W2]|uniref:hypothetical protein n=1 Tax=Cupriavidus sp. TMH.W2 TaxID=3434465 RepID=UPI003D77A8EF
MSGKVSGLSLMRPDRMAPSEFKSMLVGKGWRMADVACRWGIKPETLSRLVADPSRDTKWDDLARALPRLSRAERAAATAARRALAPPKKRSRNLPEKATLAPVLEPPARTGNPIADLDAEFAPPQRQNGLRYHGYVTENDELIAAEDVGEFASAGDHLYVKEVRLGAYADGAVREEYLAETESGETLWLTPEEMDQWMVASGRSRPT